MANGAASPLRRPAPERGLVNWFRVQASEPRTGSPSQALLTRAGPGLPVGQPTASGRPSRQRDRRGPRSLRTRSPPVGAALRVRIPKPGDVSHTPARPLALLVLFCHSHPATRRSPTTPLCGFLWRRGAGFGPSHTWAPAAAHTPAQHCSAEREYVVFAPFSLSSPSFVVGKIFV